MPCYEYKCTKCINTVEIIKKFSDSEDEICPKCSEKMKRKVSKNSFTLGKGSWFKNGYNKGG